ncbi:YtzI protein [Bacillus aquiflavi]|uniref:YtzI protein n=1 Tax=Bacillus aquiflavi TaxID=2672567 RepID=A0A6B3VYA0_9BACI|nr:YtzI protein [Bacillus aquiflavi]MBA4536878.1 YtzI protein [Bacillus aquiflavi]NEY81245.1 YtzI protein [Bacillus aquiflavi]UAC47639.1 YtzI protein [Bacillus aquiflavi]
MKIILILSILIVAVVLILTLFATSKAYSYKHTVDPIKEDDPQTNYYSDKEKVN